MIQSSLLRWYVDRVISIEPMWLRMRTDAEIPGHIRDAIDRLFADLKYWRNDAAA